MNTSTDHHYNEEIQVLRAIAILAIIIHHLQGLFFWDAKWQDPGLGLWVGLDLFFCVSGYVIAKTLLPRLEGKQGAAFWKETGAFWLRRLYRITPSAWLWILIPVLVSPLMMKTHTAQTMSWNLADFASVVFHVANFHFYRCSITPDAYCGYFGSYWTLSLEEQFYLLLPIFMFVFRKRLPIVLIALVLAQVFIPRKEWADFLSFVRTDAILLGVLIAIFSYTPSYKLLEPNLNTSRFRFFMPPVLLVSLYSIARYEVVSFYMGLGAIACAVIVWLCSYDKGYFFKKSFIRKPFVWIGERSYSMYLIHNPVFWFTRETWAWLRPDAEYNDHWIPRFTLTALLYLIVLTELNYRFIEQPLRKRGKEYSKKMLLRQA